MKNKKPESRRIRMTKRLIKESLIELLEKKDIEKINISELCKQADVNRTTFYNHYGNQYEVLEEIGNDIVSKILELTTNNSKDSILSLNEQITIMGYYLQKNPIEAKLLLKHFTADNKVIQNLLLKRDTMGHIHYLSSIENYDEDTRRLLFHFLSHGIYNLIRHWILDEIDKTPEEIGKLATEIAFKGWLKEETKED